MDRFTLTQAAKALAVPQHRLIHLCEQAAIIPDIEKARGRGSSRAFSRRNIFEFAVALQIRRAELPVSVVRVVLRALRAFEAEVRRQIDGFALPDSLAAPRAPKLSVWILDGERLHFLLRVPGQDPKVFSGIDVPHSSRYGRRPAQKGIGRLKVVERSELEKGRTRTEIDLSGVASDLAGLEARIG
jgi:hypothetical protein